MLREPVSVPVGNPLEPPLEGEIVEGLDLPARIADEVVVVRAVRVRRLEPGDAVAEVDPMDESEVGELLEDPVDARDADLPPLAPQGVEELLRGAAALLSGEVGDDLVARGACTCARTAELFVDVVGPGASHETMIVVLSTRFR